MLGKPKHCLLSLCLPSLYSVRELPSSRQHRIFKSSNSIRLQHAFLFTYSERSCHTGLWIDNICAKKFSMLFAQLFTENQIFESVILSSFYPLSSPVPTSTAQLRHMNFKRRNSYRLSTMYLFNWQIKFAWDDSQGASSPL